MVSGDGTGEKPHQRGNWEGEICRVYKLPQINFICKIEIPKLNNLMPFINCRSNDSSQDL